MIFSRKIQNSLVGMKAKVHLGKQKAFLEGEQGALFRIHPALYIPVYDIILSCAGLDVQLIAAGLIYTTS